MALLTRLPFRSKAKLSKYESALEDAFAQKTLYTASVNDTSTLTYVPDYIVVPDQDNSSTALVLPTTAATEGKVCVVINNDTDDAITVNGVSIVVSATTTIRFDGSSWVKLNTHANA